MTGVVSEELPMLVGFQFPVPEHEPWSMDLLGAGAIPRGRVHYAHMPSLHGFVSRPVDCCTNIVPERLCRVKRQFSIRAVSWRKQHPARPHQKTGRHGQAWSRVRATGCERTECPWCEANRNKPLARRNSLREYGSWRRLSTPSY